MVGLSAAFRTAASWFNSSSEGHTLVSGLGKLERGARPSVSCKATSPGITTTETPRREIAVWMAISRTRGIWSGWETSSQ